MDHELHRLINTPRLSIALVELLARPAAAGPHNSLLGAREHLRVHARLHIGHRVHALRCAGAGITAFVFGLRGAVLLMVTADEGLCSKYVDAISESETRFWSHCFFSGPGNSLHHHREQALEGRHESIDLAGRAGCTLSRGLERVCDRSRDSNERKNGKPYFGASRQILE